MISEEKDKLLEQYVAGQPMSREDEAQVEHLLKNDPEFVAEYRIRQELVDFGKRERRASWDTRQTARSSPSVRPRFPMRWVAAASIVLLLGIGLAWWGQSFSNQPSSGQMALFEKHDAQLGLAGADSLAVGTIGWVVTRANADQYEFSQLDTLRIFAADPTEWNAQHWQLIRLSEVRYQLRVGKRSYSLEQGRQMRLPLEPEQVFAGREPPHGWFGCRIGKRC